MLKNIFSLFNIPIYVSLVFVMLFCLAAVCGCGSPGASQKMVDVRNTPPKDLPSVPDIPPGVNINDTELGKRIRQDFSNYEVDRVGYAYPDITAENVIIHDY